MDNPHKSDKVRRMPKQPRMAPESLPAIQKRLRLLRSAVCQDRHVPDRQSEFARFMGFPVQTWNNLEVGKGRISIDTAMEISRQLEIPVLVAWIYQGAAEKELPDWLMRVIRADRDEPDHNGAPVAPERRRA
jgi:DNA-binding XRE family transcriptional regulator